MPNRCYAATPKIIPTPAVAAIASAPQKVTRAAPFRMTGPASGCTHPSENRQSYQCRPGYDEANLPRWRHKRNDQRDHGANRECQRGNNGCLDRVGHDRFGDPQFVARVSRKRIPLSQLQCDLPRNAAVFVFVDAPARAAGLKPTILVSLSN